MDDNGVLDELPTSRRQVSLLLYRAAAYGDSDADIDRTPYDFGRYEYLLLESVDARPGTFRRIGYVMFGRRNMFHTPAVGDEAHAVSLATCQALDKHCRSHDVPQHMYHGVDDDFRYTITLV